MADSKNIQAAVERVIAEVLDSRLAALRQEIVARVLAELEPALTTPSAASGTTELDAAIASVQDGSVQADILRAMVEGAAKFAGRVVLLVQRGGALTAWQARGLDGEALRSMTFDPARGLAGRAIADRTPAGAAAAEFDSAFVERFGNPADGNAVVLPLVVREKVPAVLYADAGVSDPKFDGSALQLLVRSTGLWLELLALRKSAGAPEADATPTTGISAMAAAAAAAPAAAPAAAAPAPPPPVAAAPPPPVVAAAPQPAGAPAVSPQDQEVHAKAKRFAKLLVDEIKLYNQAKVAEGRKNKDLYDRLHDDIEKSRATYDKRYGATAAAAANYFHQEIIRILADNDPSLLGSNYPGT